MNYIMGTMLFIYGVLTLFGVPEVKPQEDIAIIFLLLGWLMWFKKEDIKK